MTPTCDAPTDSANICLTQEQTLWQLIKLLPRGRAWRSDIDAPIRRSFWNAVAGLYAYIEIRICQLALEFFCFSETETDEIWMEQYGLPDACDPYPTLCAKVAAFGGTRCEYYAAIAALSGWAIDCVALTVSCGSKAGCSFAGNAIAGGTKILNVLRIIVHIAESPSYRGGVHTPSLAGCMRAGQPLSCGPDISPLACILERVVHAHVEIDYQIG